MRDRLIELLKVAKKNRGMYSPEGYLMGATFNIPLVEDKYVELLADHLLANGVIVPPCKVGQKVYCVWQYSDFAKEEPPFIKETRAVAWVIDEGVPKVVTEDYGEMTDSWHQLLAVGFTKEEAEKALERSENGKS